MEQRFWPPASRERVAHARKMLPRIPPAHRLRIHASLALALTGLLWGCSRADHAMALPGPVTTAAGGYALAMQIQSEAAPRTYLSRVLVVLHRDGQDFEVAKVIYGFNSLMRDGSALQVTMDNTRMRAFIPTNSPGPAGRTVPPEAPPVLLSGKDVWDVLEIAKRNGLGEFCAIVPPGDETIFFQLEGSVEGSVWHITADGLNSQGPTAQLRMNIDAASGNVLSRHLQRLPGRQ
jgi:hypothetical protein